MNELKEKFVKLASAVLADNKELASKSITFEEMLVNETVNCHKEKLRGHFNEFSSIDNEYAEQLCIGAAINDLQKRSAQVQILAQARIMLVSAIKNYESSLTEFEGQVKFRLNITIAVIALVVSIVGIIV